MSNATLTTAQANDLYRHNLAILEGPYILTTRTAIYDWNPTAQRYERLDDQLKVTHRAGVTWSKAHQQFVTCECRHCLDHPFLAADIEIYNR